MIIINSYTHAGACVDDAKKKMQCHIHVHIFKFVL